MPQTASEIECSLCGRDGGPIESCNVCNGNKRFVQERHFTLSEERQGVGHSDPKRYGRDGAVQPKAVRLPGSFVPGSEQ
jgi:hypothetical protein